MIGKPAGQIGIWGVTEDLPLRVKSFRSFASGKTPRLFAARLECRGARRPELLYAAYGVEMRPPFFVFSCKKKLHAVDLDQGK